MQKKLSFITSVFLFALLLSINPLWAKDGGNPEKSYTSTRKQALVIGRVSDNPGKDHHKLQPIVDRLRDQAVHVTD